MQRFVMVVTAIGAGVVLSGCGCTDIGCSGGLSVSLSELPDEPGLYEVSATGDGTASCQFEVDEGGAVVEDDADDACFSLPTSQTLTLLLIEGEYEVVLSDEAGELASVQVSRRDWSTFSPNGRLCGGGCDSAAVSLTL